MNKIKKVTKTHVKQHIKEHGFWEGYLLGNKTHPSHCKGGWHLGFRVCHEMFGDYLETPEQALAFFDKMCREYLWCLEPELGSYIHYYEEVDR